MKLNQDTRFFHVQILGFNILFIFNRCFFVLLLLFLLHFYVWFAWNCCKRARARVVKSVHCFQLICSDFKNACYAGYGSRTMSARLQPTSIHLHIHWVISKIDRNAVSFEWKMLFFTSSLSVAKPQVQWNFICSAPSEEHPFGSSKWEEKNSFYESEKSARFGFSLQ